MRPALAIGLSSEFASYERHPVSWPCAALSGESYAHTTTLAEVRFASESVHPSERSIVLAVWLALTHFISASRTRATAAAKAKSRIVSGQSTWLLVRAAIKRTRGRLDTKARMRYVQDGHSWFPGRFEHKHASLVAKFRDLSRGLRRRRIANLRHL